MFAQLFEQTCSLELIKPIVYVVRDIAKSRDKTNTSVKKRIKLTVFLVSEEVGYSDLAVVDERDESGVTL